MQEIERFFSKVRMHTEIKSEHVRTPCWEWMACRDKWGYGQYRDANHRNIRAHWRLLPRYPTANEYACHKCDNVWCVRPSHLFIGTPKANSEDTVRKGKMSGPKTIYRGEANKRAKLSNSDAAFIRRNATRQTVKWFAGRFKVCEATIYNVLNGRRYTK